MTKAQQDPMFSQNMFNHVTVNPAFAGMKGILSVSAVYRTQWQNMTDAPEIYAVNVDAPFSIKNTNNGIGINLLNEKIGLQNNSQLMLNYAFKGDLGWGMLNVGTKLGILQLKFDNDFYIPEMDGNTDPGSDPALNTSELSKIKFDVGIGVFLTGNNFYAGASLTHLTKPSMTVGTSGEFFWKQSLNLTSGYNIPLSPVIKMQPSFFLQSDFVSNQYILNANFTYKETYWAGLSYRYESTVTFIGGLELKNGLQLGYSYDMNWDKIASDLGGSHEITLSYTFGLSLGKKDKVYKSIRFL
jgi:type IX secretion system PorP/SprF family membrane protein